MADFDLSDAIALRHYELGPSGKVTVYIWAPEAVPDQDHEYTCAYGIEGLEGKPIRRKCHGIDAFQALTLALRAIRLYLDFSREDAGQALLWLGQSEFHGFEAIQDDDASSP